MSNNTGPLASRHRTLSDNHIESSNNDANYQAERMSVHPSEEVET